MISSPFPVSRHHLSNDCLEDKREDNQNCSVLYCVLLCTAIRTHVSSSKVDYGFRFVFIARSELRISFCFCAFCDFVVVVPSGRGPAYSGPTR